MLITLVCLVAFVAVLDASQNMQPKPSYAGQKVANYRPHYIPYHPYTQHEELVINTNSRRGSRKWLYVWLADQQRGVAGYIQVQFSGIEEYTIGYCDSYTAWKNFHVHPPPEQEKTWRIKITRPGPRIIIECNGVVVLDLILSASTCTKSAWEQYWSKDISQMYFHFWDDASSQYCISSGQVGNVPLGTCGVKTFRDSTCECLKYSERYRHNCHLEPYSSAYERMKQRSIAGFSEQCHKYQIACYSNRHTEARRRKLCCKAIACYFYGSNKGCTG